MATYTKFYKESDVLDQGITLYFKNPKSFTGEDIVELHTHGGNIVINTVLKEVLYQGARMAQPGEFSFRAYMNNKLDLTQAESIASLISATSESSARCATLSLQGELKKIIEEIHSKITYCITQIESHIDFTEEDISPKKCHQDITNTISLLEETIDRCQQGITLNTETKNTIAEIQMQENPLFSIYSHNKT